MIDKAMANKQITTTTKNCHLKNLHILPLSVRRRTLIKYQSSKGANKSLFNYLVFFLQNQLFFIRNN